MTNSNELQLISTSEHCDIEVNEYSMNLPFITLTSLTKMSVQIAALVNMHILGVVAKLRKATTSFVMSLCPLVRTSIRMEQLGPHWTNFHEI